MMQRETSESPTTTDFANLGLAGDDGPFRALLAAAVDAMIVIDARARILMVNPSAERMFGYGAAELIGQNVSILMTAQHAPKHDRYLDNYARTGRRKIIGIGRTEEGRRKDGSAFPLEISVGEYWHDGAHFFVGILRDITQRRVTEQAIKRERDFSQAILETTPALVVVLDEKGYVIRFNAACERATGYDRGDVLGRNIFDLLIPEGDAAAYSDIRDRLTTGKDVAQIEAGWKTRTGGQVRIAWNYSLLEGEGGRHTYLIGTGYDVTEARGLQEQLARAQRLEALGQLTGGVAHDFNNLLAVIQGNMEMLEAAMPADDANIDLVQEALDAASLGARLTGRLLAFARRQPLTPQTVRIQDLMTGTTELLRRSLGEGLRFTARVDPNLWPVATDPGQIENAILNLALNARDAMAGRGELDLVIRNAAQRTGAAENVPGTPMGDFVRIDVTDTGCGMPPEMIERIFDPFFTTKAAGSGTGLGLSMVYGFVRQSGGHIHVESEVGRGTTITILLPRSAQETTQAGRDGGPAGKAAQAADVLLVEDNPAVRKTVARTLEGLGYRVTAAAGGRQAIDYLERGEADFAFVLSDIVMPGDMSGFELEQTIAARWPSLRCLLMSGFADSNLPEDMARTDILRKPFKAAELKDAIARAFAGR